MKKTLYLFVILSILCSTSILAQSGGTVRGNIYDKDTGEPIIYGNILLQNTDMGTNSDENGFFSLGNVPPGTYNLVVTYVGYDSTAVSVNIKARGIVHETIYLSESAVQLGVVDISARREQAKSEVQVSKITLTPSQIKSLPSVGGQTDIAQYLTVIPGILSTGDQGGQIYIRGGSPVQNKILLDGLTIYNPFHSIGFFSVFETETIRTVDVLTGGFNAEYGGRISAIVDIKTREGNKKRFGGQLAVNPFQVKGLVEGPIKKLEEGGGSVSFMLTGKHSYIDKTSPYLYAYAVDTSLYSFASDTSAGEQLEEKLPFSFTDLYGKLSFVTANGSKLNLFGFNFKDKVDYTGFAELDWDVTGGGANFSLLPPNSNLIIGGTFGFSNYEIILTEADGNPRRSGITAFNALMDFTYFGLNSEVKYGFEVNGFNSDFEFRNFVGNTIKQKDFTTELGGFILLKQKLGNWIFEPSLRFQFYASQPASTLEPRLGIKYNAKDNLRFKLAGGLYSQNLISSVNERDVVNLFVGLLAGPEETIFKPNGVDRVDHRLQKSVHAVVGTEVDILPNLELNVETYYKGFTQLIQINRNKLTAVDPNFVTETGKAFGIDFSLRYELKKMYLWATYSLGRVERDDGTQIYPTIFDRRHNVNLLGTYKFGDDLSWEFGARWNVGSGFPFTLTQGFYNGCDYTEGLDTEPLTDNCDLNIIFDEDRNSGRLPYYHRLDISLKKMIHFSKNASLEIAASVTNAYDRDNIFFFDRVRYERVNQLPVLPSLNLSFSF